uniref:NADH-ubiquinone oxidoreductase chain 1 n=1 Tax=Analcellicampa danfengensis TaxID=2419779 RepID=A0A7U0IUW8_9HYME|nr:NADH dehydrogenase subunit 1 [Analcellicampa danfengensis]QQV69259.1 NADH dehydrogenase subunit 1 [Analcellicampa danfengensis]
MTCHELYLFILNSLNLAIMVMVGVAFLTLMERKLLGYIQIRKGPNKVSLLGILQPFCDVIKLFSKEQIFPSISNYYPYYISPIFSLFLILSSWLMIPYFTNLCSFNLSILFFLCCTSMGVYSIMIAGWSSNSKYSLLGGLRSVAQTISYEVSMAIILMCFFFLIEDYNFLMFYNNQNYIWFIFITFPLSMVWFIICLAETNRTPFDFAEGESELVSGFNVEYSSGSFALIFMAEYASILFMSMLFSVMFLGGNLFSLMFFIMLTLISFLFIWVRGTLPRLRYDKLMSMAWKSFLPVSLNCLLFYLSLKVFFSVIII